MAKRLSVGTAFFVALLLSFTSDTLSGGYAPTETPRYTAEFEYMTQEAQ